MSEERLKVDVALEKLTRLEKWIEQINDAVCRHGIHVTCQADENRKISRRVDELEELLLNHQKIGEEWIKLFKKLNADRMMEDVALKHRQDILEKKTPGTYRPASRRPGKSLFHCASVETLLRTLRLPQG